MNHTLRSRQLNPCDDLFWKSRGYPERPLDWQQRLEDMGYYDSDGEESESDSEYSEESSEGEYSEDCSDDDESDYDDEESDDSEYEEHRLISNQKNPNNDEYWIARGWNGRPDDWRERVFGNS